MQITLHYFMLTQVDHISKQFIFLWPFYHPFCHTCPQKVRPLESLCHLRPAVHGPGGLQRRGCVALLLPPSPFTGDGQATPCGRSQTGICCCERRVGATAAAVGTVPLSGAVPMSPHLGGGSWGRLTAYLAVLA